MKAENNLTFFISLLQREVRNSSTKSASGTLPFQLPGSLHRRKYLENIGARLTGTTFGHQLLAPAQCKPENCLQEFVPQKDSSPPTTWPTLQRVVTSGWTQTRLLQGGDWKNSPFEEFKWWENLTHGLSWATSAVSDSWVGLNSCAFAGNRSCLTSVLFPWQNAFFWVSPQSSLWGVVLERHSRTGLSALFNMIFKVWLWGKEGKESNVLI